MSKHLNNYLTTALMALVLFLLCGNAFAGNESYLQGLKGTQLTTGGVLGVKDPFYSQIINNSGPNPLVVGGQFYLAESEMRVHLHLDETAGEYHGTDWLLEVEYNIDWQEYDDVTDTWVNQSATGKKLTIDYAPTGTYTDRELHRYLATINAEVEVTSVTFKDGAGNVISKSMPADVILDLEYHADRYHELDATVPEIRTALVSNTFDGTVVQNQLDLNWNYISGAEYYELEYLFVETGDIDPIGTPIPYDWKNATRVEIPGNHYRLNLAFPSGALLYRVRGIGISAPTAQTNVRVEGAWSYDPTDQETDQAFADNNTTHYDIARHLPGLLPEMNWQYSAGFVEDGKRKEVFSIFDGSLRSRQQQTLINTEKHALVGETIYDHQGRATVSVMPVPVTSLGLGYYTGSGTTLNGGFDRTYFDSDLRLSASYTGYTGPQPLPSSSASSTYYSGNNPLSFELRELVPDAGGYAYSQSVPLNDGTGRLRSSGGVGSTFAIGADHTTDYFYSRPTPYQLNRLFGSEVGKARFYQKTLTRDPNGQVSVAYTDHAGRTIATALSGNTTQNLLDLDDKPAPVMVTENLLADGSEVNLDGELEATFFIEVVDPLNFSYTVDYTLNGAQNCINCVNYCQTCQYDYRITIDFPDGPGQWYDSGWLMGQSSATGQLSLPTTFPEAGVYKMTKRLRPSKGAAAAFRKHLIDEVMNNLTTQTCIPYEAPESVNCAPECSDLCQAAYTGLDHKGDPRYYDSDMNWLDGNGAPYTDQSPEHLAAISACEDQCNTPQGYENNLCSLRVEAMKIDMSPGGQYFDNLPAKYEKDVNGNFVLNSDGDKVIDANYFSYLRNAWLDDPGTVSVSDLVAVVGTTYGTLTDWDDVRDNWDDAMVDVLVEFHPEYCRYQFLCSGTLECDQLTVQMSDVNDYVTFMFAGHDDDYAFSATNGHNYNFFNPLGQKEMTDLTVITESEYCSAPDEDGLGNPYGRDPLWEVPCLYDAPGDLPYKLTEFLDFTDNNNVGQKFSLWYVLDDPESHHSNPPSSWPTSVADLFQTLHGDGTNPGIIGTGTGQITKYQMFRSVYLFYREQLVAELADELACGGNNTAYWDDDTDFDGIRNSDGYQLLFPPNPLMGANPITTTQNALCDQSCTAFATDWMNQLEDCIQAKIVANNLTQIEIDNLYSCLRHDLIELCKKGCDDGHLMGHSTPTGNINACDNSANTIEDFQDAIEYYLGTSCTTVVVHPPASNDPEDCHCGPLGEYITVNNLVSGTNPFAPTIAELTAITTAINNENWDSYQYTVSEVTNWVGHCNNGFGDITSVYPDELECVDCKCGELLEFIDQHGLVSTDHTAIANELESEFGGSYSPALVSAWLSECGNTNPDETKFGSFPELLDCPNQLGPALDLNNLAMQLCEDELARIDEVNKARLFQQRLLAMADAEYRAYLENCRNSAVENMTATYPLDEFYYTLFYYDQAGNLVKTVAPREVDPSMTTGTSVLVDSDRDQDNGTLTHPAHKAVTRYTYDGLNQLVEQNTPDGGKSRFWYNRIGQLLVSQNARQAAASGGSNYLYSYTRYDELGRAVEGGEMTSSNDFMAMSSTDVEAILNDPSWPDNAASSRTEVTQTYYDYPAIPAIIGQFNGGQRYLRNRVASVTWEAVWDNDDATYDQASHYSYDIHGNVEQFMQENRELAGLGQQFKQMSYTYDLVGGLVKEVAVQDGQLDAFYHRYCYDADNRITEVYTSTDRVIWERDAKYFYSPHGPLARTELGDRQVQATDHAYTLQGYLKSVNANTLNVTRDPGKDGLVAASNLNQHFAADAYGYSLHYYEGDYTPIAATNHLAAINSGTAFHTAGHDLFNGNISRMITALTDDNEEHEKIHGAVYRHDQLNRFKSARFFKDNNSGDLVAANNHFDNATDNADYAVATTLDFNGNLKTLTRNGVGGQMDDFTYHYDPAETDNRLYTVEDPFGNVTGDDLPNQLPTGVAFSMLNPFSQNYEYDDSGQLIKDKAEEIENITWTVDGKVKTVTRSTNSQREDLEFLYDPAGYRIGKIVKPRPNGSPSASTAWEYTWYLRDAQGNLLNTYTMTGANATSLMHDEVMLYGSKRLGTKAMNVDVTFPTGPGKITLSGDAAYCVPAEVVLAVDGVNINPAVQWQDANTANNLKTAINSLVTTPDYTASTDPSNPYVLYIHPVDCPQAVQTITSNTTITCGNWNMSVNQQIGPCSDPVYQRTLATKGFELSNHLGNVLEVVSDRKIAVDDNTDNIVDGYIAEVNSYSDYYPYGMTMPGRKSTNDHRFGFQDQETDEEIWGGSSFFKYRMNDSRIGRFFAVDPLVKKYPEWSPFSFSGNQVIASRELEGLEPNINLSPISNGARQQTPLEQMANLGTPTGVTNGNSESKNIDDKASLHNAVLVPFVVPLFVPEPIKEPVPESPPTPENAPEDAPEDGNPAIGPFGRTGAALLLWELFYSSDVNPSSPGNYRETLQPRGTKELRRDDKAILRVQLQQKRNHLSSETAYNTIEKGVTVNQAVVALDWTMNNALNGDARYLRKSPEMKLAWKKMTFKLRSMPPTGLVAGPYQTTLQEKFTYQGYKYRIDVESIRGHNLRE